MFCNPTTLLEYDIELLKYFESFARHNSIFIIIKVENPDIVLVVIQTLTCLNLSCYFDVYPGLLFAL